MSQDKPKKELTQKDVNLYVWEQTRKTDPKFCKEFQGKGGFKGTAIDPMWNYYRATALFGPCGVGWGHIVHETRVEYDVWCTLVQVWYMWEGKKRFTGEQWGQTTMVTNRKGQRFIDEEAPKKAVTD